MGRLHIDTKEIISLYYDIGLSTVEIADFLGCTPTAIRYRLDKAGVARRGLSESQYTKRNSVKPKELDDYETLYDMYVVKRMPKSAIAKAIKTSTGCIDRSLRKYGIHVRGSSESKIGTRNGCNHPNWRGGISTLSSRLREFYQTNISPRVRSRDGFKCRMCGAKSDLHTHHIYPFSKIVQDICSEHKELDLVKDVNTLYEICISDKRFLDMDNLITVCKNCHLGVIHKKSTSSQGSSLSKVQRLDEIRTPQADGGGNGGAPI